MKDLPFSNVFYGLYPRCEKPPSSEILHLASQAKVLGFIQTQNQILKQNAGGVKNMVKFSVINNKLKVKPMKKTTD